MTYHARIRMTIADETCPQIDSVIKSTTEAYKLADKYGGQCDNDTFTDQFREIEMTLYGIEDEMEVIRKANKSLRDALTEALRELDKVEISP